MNILKRHGKIENLTKKKIIDSICKANNSVSKDNQLSQNQIKRISNSIYLACEDKFNEDSQLINIDWLEDIVEQKLMESFAYEVAKQYIKYRYEKERIRTFKNISEKLMAKNVENQNANIDEFSYGGRIGETASYIMKDYALNNFLSPMAKNNHNNNEIYIHDFDHYAVGDHNCLSIPFDDFLKDGFNTRQVDIRPANSVSTAMQLIAVIFQIQSLQQFGGVASTHLDHTMVPYVRKSFFKYFKEGLRWIEGMHDEEIQKFENEFLENEKKIQDISIEHEQFKKYNKVYEFALTKLKDEIDQSTEGLFHNLNSLQSRSGNQLPFTSINYGTCTSLEGRMVIKSLLDNAIKGVGKFHKTPIFPCVIFQSAKGINREPGDPNYDLFQLALKCTAKRLYPNYANCDWSVDGSSANSEREKQEILDSLTESQKEKLIDAIKNDPSIANKLGLELIEK
jgi:ribonucleoside-triphosphate reductase